MKRVTAGLTAAALSMPLAALACPEVPFAFREVAPYALMLPRALNAASPILWTLGLLAMAIASVRERKAPGFLQVLFAPGFWVPAVLATSGAFFLRWLPVGDFIRFGLSLPLPDMDQLAFGPSMDGNPLFYSALVPGLISLAGVRWQGARRVVAGLACGFAGTMAAAAWNDSPGLSILTERWASFPWLVVNAAGCLFIARAMFVAEARRD